MKNEFISSKKPKILITVLIFIMILSLNLMTYSDTEDSDEIDLIIGVEGNRSTVIFKDGHYGLMDENGDLIDLVRRYEVIHFTDIYECLIVTIDTGELDENGYKIEKSGLIDRNGKELFLPEYDHLNVLNRNCITVYDGETDTYAVYNIGGDLLIPHEAGYNNIILLDGHNEINGYGYMYDYKLLRVKIGEKYGIIDYTGKKITDVIYDEMYYMFNHANGSVKVKRDGYSGFVNRYGTEVIPVKYKSLTYDDGFIAHSDNNGLLTAQYDTDKFGLVTINNKVILPFEYDRIVKNGKDKYFVDKNSKRYIFNIKTGAITFHKDFEFIAMPKVLPPSGWANESIVTLEATGEFRPNTFTDFREGITRGEFIYLAVRLYEMLDGQEITPDESISFTDTTDIYALKGATVGITSGISENEFGPNELLKREQLATFMIRILKFGNVSMKEVTSYKFVDEDKFNSWSNEAIYIAKANNIVGGIGNDIFDPQGIASTEMALVIANRILKNNIGKEWTRSDDEIAHITDLTVKGTGEVVAPEDIRFRDSDEFKALMSKYGKNTENQIYVSSRNYGFAYYAKSYPRQQTYSVEARVSEGMVSFTFHAYNESIRNVVMDFMDFTYSENDGHRDVVYRIFADIESTYIIDEQGSGLYGTSVLNQKIVTVGDVTIEYRDDATFTVTLIF